MAAPCEGGTGEEWPRSIQGGQDQRHSGGSDGVRGKVMVNESSTHAKALPDLGERASTTGAARRPRSAT